MRQKTENKIEPNSLFIFLRADFPRCYLAKLASTKTAIEIQIVLASESLCNPTYIIQQKKPTFNVAA